MRILAFSDLHADRKRVEALLAQARSADLVIGAGDFCNMRKGLAEVMEWLEPIAGKAVYVPGNAESVDELHAATKATVLHGTQTERQGIPIFGIGYAVPVTPFGGWSCDLSERTAEAMLDMMRGARILISHSPPKGVADMTSHGLSIGSVALRAAIERVQPKYCLCGHVHDSWGEHGMIGQTEVINLGPKGRMLEYRR